MYTFRVSVRVQSTFLEKNMAYVYNTYFFLVELNKL